MGKFADWLKGAPLIDLNSRNSFLDIVRYYLPETKLITYNSSDSSTIEAVYTNPYLSNYELHFKKYLEHDETPYKIINNFFVLERRLTDTQKYELRLSSNGYYYDSVLVYDMLCGLCKPMASVMSEKSLIHQWYEHYLPLFKKVYSLNYQFFNEQDLYKEFNNLRNAWNSATELGRGMEPFYCYTRKIEISMIKETQIIFSEKCPLLGDKDDELAHTIELLLGAFKDSDVYVNLHNQYGFTI